jgi:hypothetical protein
MQLRTRALLALTAMGGSAAMLPTLAAAATDFGYTYAEARYLDINRDSGNDAEGLTAIGWYRLNERFFLTGQIIGVDFDGGADAQTYALGGGFIQSLNDHWDAVLMTSFRHVELDTGPRTTSDNGYVAQLGLRGMPIPKLEARAFVNYVNVNRGETSFFLSGEYWFSPSLAAGLAAEFGETADTISVGIRYAFGP